MGTRTGNPTWANAPATTSPISATALENIETAIDASATLASPTFTGDPKAPTPATSDNDTSIATTAYVKAQAYATLASPTFTGDPKAPTPTAGDNDTSIATTAFVTTAVAAIRGQYVGVNAQTGTTYTIVLADQGKFVTLTNAAAITVTLPSDASVAIPVGGSIDFQVRGAGMATFAAGSGATVDGTPSLVTRANKSAVTAIKVAANTWTVIGDLA